MIERKVRLSGEIQRDSIVDGDGIRTVIWFQGCPHKCPGCHNPESHDFQGGFETNISDIISILDKLDVQDGITFSGGEPMSQPYALYEIAKYAKSIGLNVWSYTGYTFEELLEKFETQPIFEETLNYIDVLVDGKFELDKKSLDLQFKGSSNQRIINVKRSLKEKRPVLIPKYKSTKSAKKTIKNTKKTLFT